MVKEVGLSCRDITAALKRREAAAAELAQQQVVN